MDMPMYNALLKWSLTQTDGTTGPSTALPMSDEKREFLKKAMESFVLDETMRMKDILTILKFEVGATAVAQSLVDGAAAPVPAGEAQAAGSAPRASTETTSVPPPLPAAETTPLSYQYLVNGTVAARQDDKDATFLVDMLRKTTKEQLIELQIEALRELQERVEQIDNATFFACGAKELPLLLQFVKHGPPAIQLEACNVLKTVLQNNPKTQEKALEDRALPVLATIAVAHTHPNVRTKAFSALSALLRTITPEPILAFAAAGGFERVVGPLLCSGHKPLQRKVLFFLQYVVNADPSFSAQLAEKDITNIVGRLLATKDDFDIVEQSATIIDHLLKKPDRDVTLTVLRDESVQAKEKLQVQIDAIAEQPAEELVYFEDAKVLFERVHGQL